MRAAESMVRWNCSCGWLAVLFYEGCHAFERRRADVMLDALGIACGVGRGDANGAQERKNCFVPLASDGGQSFALSGQADRPMRRGLDKFLFLQARDDTNDRHVRNAEVLGQVLDAALTMPMQDVRNRLDVILCSFHRMVRTDLAEGAGYGLGLGPGHKAPELRRSTEM